MKNSTYHFADDAARVRSMQFNLKSNARRIGKWAQQHGADLPTLKAEMIRRCPLPLGVERDAIIRLIEEGAFDSEFLGILGHC